MIPLKPDHETGCDKSEEHCSVVLCQNLSKLIAGQYLLVVVNIGRLGKSIVVVTCYREVTVLRFDSNLIEISLPVPNDK